jgi:hypothetical protein
MFAHIAAARRDLVRGSSISVRSMAAMTPDKKSNKIVPCDCTRISQAVKAGGYVPIRRLIILGFPIVVILAKDHYRPRADIHQ